MAHSIPVYVAHYDKAPERKEYLTKALSECGFDRFYFSSQYCDRERIYNEETVKLVNTSRALSRMKFIRSGMKSEFHALSPRQPAYLGNFLNHISIWTRIAISEDEYALVLEDDAVITDSSILNAQLVNLPCDIDIGYLPQGVVSHLRTTIIFHLAMMNFG